MARKDRRLRDVLIYSRGRPLEIRVAGFAEASLVGRYMSAVGRFRRTNDPGHLKPFEGLEVTDDSGRDHPLETNPRLLYRMTLMERAPFDEIYRIVE
jgi:hypothetical protein